MCTKDHFSLSSTFYKMLPHTEYMRTWRAANPEKDRQYDRRRRAANPEARRSTMRKSYFKRKAEQGYEVFARAKRDNDLGKGAHEHFTKQLAAQGNCCAMCDKPFTNTRDTCLDHDHTTNQWRGALCGRCNRALGYYENTEWRQRALLYLAKWQGIESDPSLVG